MGYGIQVTASGGEFQIDSSLSTTQHLAIHEKGSVSAGEKIIIDFGDVVFVRASGSNGRVQVKTNRSTEVVGGTTYAIGRVYTFIGATDYIITKPASSSSHSTAIAATDYGIQVKNQSDDVCFDSRTLNFGLEITQVHARNSFYGGHSSIYGYSASNNTVFTGAANTLNPANAAYRHIYVSVFGAEYSGSVTDGILVSGYNYVSSTNKIYHEGFVAWTSQGGFYNGQVPILNHSEILVGELFE